MLFIAQERSPKYADKFLDKVKPLLVEPKVSRRLCFFSFSQSSIWSYVNVYNGVYSVAIHSNTLNGSRLTSQETDIKFFGIPICYAEYVALREFRVLKSIVDLLAAARSAKVQQVVLSRCLRPAPLQHTYIYIKHIYSAHETTPFGSFVWGSFGEKEMLENLNI